jgi:hypothetical protein
VYNWFCGAGEGMREGAGGHTTTKVPGRKNIVRSAMAFMADESLLLSRAMSLPWDQMSMLSLLLIVAFWISSFD